MISLAKHYPHYRALLSLGLPIVVGQVGNIVLGFADTLMVGHHSMQELAAASFVNNMFMLFVVFSVGFANGVTPIVGRHHGRGEVSLIAPALREGLVANTVFALFLLSLLTVFYFSLDYIGQPEELLPMMRPYLLVNILSMPFICWANTFRQFFDALGQTKVSMCVLLGGNVLNIFGNYLLIYGAWGFPELGLLGAGLSTVFSRVLMALAFFLVFLCARRYKVYSRGFFSGGMTRAGFAHFNAVSWPSGLQLVMESAAFSLAALLVGWLGTTALAAHQVMITVSQLFYMVYTGLASAVAIRVSHFHGQHDQASVRLSASSGFQLIVVVACVVALPVFLLRNTVSYWFTDSAEVCHLVSQTIILLILQQLGDGMQCTYANALRGLGCVKPLVRIAFVSYFVLSLPLSWLFGIYLGFGLRGVWLGFPVSLIFAGIAFFTAFNRQMRLEDASALPSQGIERCRDGK